MTSGNPDDYELLQPQSRFSAGRVDADRAGCGDRAPFLLEGKRSFGGLRRAAAHPRVRAVLFAVALLAVGVSVAAVLPAAARRGPLLPGSAPPGELSVAADAGSLDKIVNIGGNPAPDALRVGKGGPPGGAPAESSPPPEQQQQQPWDTSFRTLATASGTATLTSPPSAGPYTIPEANTLSASGASPQATELFSASKTADDSLSSSAPTSSSAGGCETRITCDGVGAGGVSRSAASDSDVESSPASSDPYDAATTSASTSGDPAFSTEAGTPSDKASTMVYTASKAGGCAAGTLCDAVDAVGVPTSTAPDGDVESTVSFDPFDAATVTSMADDPASTTEVVSKSAPPATKPVFDDAFYKLEGECATGIPCDEVDTGGMSTSAAPDDDAESPTSFDSFDAASVTSTSDDLTCTTGAAPNDPPAVTQPAGDGFHELGRVGDNSGGAGSMSEASPPDASTAAQTSTAAGRDVSANPTGVDAAGEITHEIQPFASSDATQTPAAGPDTGESLTGEIAGGDTAQSLLPAPPAETTDNGAGDSVVGLPSIGAASPEVPNAEGGTETGDVATPATEPSPSSDDVGGGAFSSEAAELLADGGFF